MRLEGRFFIRGNLTDACVEVENGVITSIKKSMDGCSQLRGIVLPGAVDLHVHFREPGATHKEDFYTGSLSALFGGVTFVADMPNNTPKIDSNETLEEKLHVVRSKANVDFTLYAMLTKKNQGESWSNGMFKWYMYEEPVLAPPEQGFISVHSEIPECIGTATSLHGYDFARPERCEVQAVRKLGDFGRKFHIAHVSSNDTVDMCNIFNFSCEVTPHHLFLHRDMELGAFGKVNPPLRAKWMSELLWEDLLRGRINVVATDHAPHTVEEKEEPFEIAPPGIPEVETYVPMFMFLVKSGRISLKRAVEVLMENPARLVGLKKGKIEIGYHADFAVYDFTEVKTIKSRDLHYKCGWTPYRGNYIKPKHVFLRGEQLIDSYELSGEPIGEFITLPV